MDFASEVLGGQDNTAPAKSFADEVLNGSDDAPTGQSVVQPVPVAAGQAAQPQPDTSFFNVPQILTPEQYLSQTTMPPEVLKTAQDNFQQGQEAQGKLDQQTLGALRKQFPDDTALQNQTDLPPGEGDKNLSRGARFDMGLSDSFSGKYDTFKQYYPTGDMREVNENGENITVLKLDDKSPWIRLSPTTQQNMAYLNEAKTPVEGAVRTLNILGDAMKNNSADAVTDLALAIAQPEAGLVKFAAKQTLRGALTRTGIEQYNEARERSTQGPSEAASTGAIDGLETAAWVGAATVALKASKYATGFTAGENGIFPLDEDAKNAKATLERIKDKALELGAPEKIVKLMNFMPQQLINWPVLNRFANQSTSWFSQIADTVTGQKNFAADVLQRMVNPTAIDEAIPRGLKAEKSEQGLIKGNLRKTVGDNNTSLVQAGDTYASDLGDYADRSQVPVRQAYAARDKLIRDAGQDLQYDAAPALRAVAEAERGTPMPYTSAPGDLRDTGLVDEYGKPIQRETPPEEGVEQLEPLSPKAQETADQIKLWQNAPPKDYVDPKTGRVTTVADQIQAMQRNLYDLTRPDASGAVHLDEARATKMRNGLQQMLDNPANNVPGLTEATAHARSLASERFENLDDPLVRRGNRQSLDELISSPEASIRTLGNISGSQTSGLARLQKVMKPENFAQVTDAIKTNLIKTITNDPSIGIKQLDNMPPEYAKIVFGDEPGTVAAYRRFAKAWGQVSDVGIGDAAANNQAHLAENRTKAATKFLSDLLGGDQTNIVSRVGTLQRMIQNDPNSYFGQSLRSGILQSMIDDNVRAFRGKASISQKEFDQSLRNLDSSTKASLLTDDDRQTLGDINTVLQWFDHTKSTGDSLVGAEGTSGLLHGKLESFLELLEHKYISYRLTNPLSQKLFYGGKYEGDVKMIKWLQEAAEGLHGAIPDNVSDAFKRLAAFAPHKSNYTTAEEENKEEAQTKKALQDAKSSPSILGGIRKVAGFASGGLVTQTDEALNHKGNGSEGFDLAPEQVLERNRGFTKDAGGKYGTTLSPEEEAKFNEWIKSNKVPFDVTSKTSDYDMRGFWQALQNKDPRAASAINQNDHKIHYPDYWKTPYDLTFSRQSQWANENAPDWNDKDQLVDSKGNVLFDDKQHRYYPIGGH